MSPVYSLFVRSAYDVCFLFSSYFFRCFFFNDTATTEIYTLSLHDALPIFHLGMTVGAQEHALGGLAAGGLERSRSEEHTSELQSQFHLVCRLLLEKKNNQTKQSDME